MFQRWWWFDPPPLRIVYIILALISIFVLDVRLIRFLHVVILIIENHAILQGFKLSLSLEYPGIHSGLDSLPTDLLQPSFLGDFGSRVWILSCPADVEDFVIVERLAGHSFFGELSVVFVGVGHECHTSVLEDTDCAELKEKTDEYPACRSGAQIPACGQEKNRLKTYFSRLHPIP